MILRLLMPLLLLPSLLLTMPMAAAGDLPAGLTRAESAAVVEVVDGDTLVLEGGTQVRLVGLQAPKLPLGRPGFPAWPLAAESKAALEDLVGGRRLVLHDGGRPVDRHGRRLAHLEREDGLWVQGAMLEGGWARVYSFPDNRAAVAAMLEREAQARAARRGIWADAWYAVLTPDQAAGQIDRFALVEGRVLKAAQAGARLYLNFGDDWRSDFTVSIDRRDLKAFAAAGFDPLGLGGRLIRVRGWIKPQGGPMIEATHPEVIERLDPD